MNPTNFDPSFNGVDEEGRSYMGSETKERIKDLLCCSICGFSLAIGLCVAGVNLPASVLLGMAGFCKCFLDTQFFE